MCLYNLSKNAVSNWKQLTLQTPLANLLRDTGWLKVYESDKAFNNTKRNLALHKQTGSFYEILSSHQITDLEPNLAPIFKHGFYKRAPLVFQTQKNWLLIWLIYLSKMAANINNFQLKV